MPESNALNVVRWKMKCIEAIYLGTREPAKLGREMCRINVPFGRDWQGSIYAIKQVAAVIVEEPEETVVVTVYTFYF